MDAPQIQPEQIATKEEQTPTASVGVESTPVAETIVSVSPSPSSPQPTISVSDEPVVMQTNQIPATEDMLDTTELTDLTTANVEKADSDWIGRVQSVIKDDEGKPFKEEVDSEKLNEDYMKTRFNVDIDAPVEEKN